MVAEAKAWRTGYVKGARKRGESCGSEGKKGGSTSPQAGWECKHPEN